jgi:hypothetical protein
MDKVEYHVLVLTSGNALIYVEYDHPVTHLEVYLEFFKDSVEVKDCFIQVQQSWNLAEILLKTVAKWVVKTFDEDVDIKSVSIRSFNRNKQYIIMEINGKTESGLPFSVRPSELLSPKINFFSEFC